MIAPASPSSPRPPRPPWPMAGVAIAIAVLLAAYTYLRLHYAKPGRAHEPYAESRAQAEPASLAAAGWRHFAANFEPLADLPPLLDHPRRLSHRPAAADELFKLSTGGWILPIAYPQISAAVATASTAPYVVHFAAELDRARAEIVGFDLYLKSGDVIVIPRWEPVGGGLVPREHPVTGRMVWPANALPAGQYRVTLLAIQESPQWDLLVAGP